ncbi:hypothetical protein HY358_02080 [Candidatus Roizmanbacteria bacterium]|nr:hypothetical protein [Candidatus Roizmanbacteria bacterium]
MSNENVIHSLNNNLQERLMPSKFFLLIIVAALVVGLGGGFLVSRLKSAGELSAKKEPKEKVAGIADKKTFRDQAEGYLKEGGIDGEGNFHLQRPGGASQNVYLTSTTVDLSLYVGKKVRVWGETFNAEKAGWLMDVGLVELLQ